MAKSWYAFMGGTEPFNVSSYFKITVTHNCLCGNTICAVLATSNGSNYPVAPFSQNMLMYINDALATGELQPQSPFDAKKYVYLKDI